MKKILVGSNGVIISNSKALYMEDETLPAEYRKLTGIVYDGNVWYNTGEKLYGSDTIKVSYKASKGCNVFGCYTSTDASTNYSLYLTTTSGGKYMRYDGGTYNSYFTTNTRYDVTITPTGTHGLKTDSTWTQKTFTSDSDMLIGSISIGATSAKFTGTMYGNIEVVGRMIYVPAERISDGAIGYYELISETFLVNQGSGTPTKLGYAS